MSKLTTSDIQRVLGIFPPFRVQSFEIEEDARKIHVKLVDSEYTKSSIFGKSHEHKLLKWDHTKIGLYGSTISIENHPQTFNRFNNLSIPPFLGHPDSIYTTQVKQFCEFGLENHLSADAVSNLTGINKVLVELVQKELALKENPANLPPLPPHASPIWESVINGEVEIISKNAKKKNMPLAMLMTNLQSAVNKEDNSYLSLIKASSRLREFFVSNSQKVMNEWRLLAPPPLVSLKSNSGQNPTTTKGSLGISDPVWKEILTRKITVTSNNAQFNLYITKLVGEYKSNHDRKSQRDIVIAFIRFLKKNSKQLTKELKIIYEINSKLVNMDDSIEFPDASHPVWAALIHGRIKLETDNLSLKLALTAMNSFEIGEGAKRLRSLFIKKSNELTNESELIHKYVKENSTEVANNG